MKKILFVDDAPDMRKLLEATFGDEEYEILEAEDGEQAVAMSLREKPDVIIMDIEMPRLNGIEATQRIKANPDTAASRIIVVSGSRRDKSVERCVAAGAEAYLSKPYSPLELLDRVERGPGPA
ncbi:MAG TPA: response regulator [Chitinivibrionales bacterium]|nr:response regulator [Chitinivibrionales bacterium]